MTFCLLKVRRDIFLRLWYILYHPPVERMKIEKDEGPLLNFTSTWFTSLGRMACSTINKIVPSTISTLHVRETSSGGMYIFCLAPDKSIKLILCDPLHLIFTVMSGGCILLYLHERIYLVFFDLCWSKCSNFRY